MFDHPFGKWFHHGFGPGPARFERGDLKLVILDLLKDKPRHGYDIIQELENKFHGFYSPSPGSVYPILQLLEDQGYVTSGQQTGKKVYTITEEGKQFLREKGDEIRGVHSRMGPPWRKEQGVYFHELRDEITQTARLIFWNAAQGALNDPEKRKRLHDAFERFRSEVEAVFSEKEGGQKTAEGGE